MHRLGEICSHSELTRVTSRKNRHERTHSALYNGRLYTPSWLFKRAGLNKSIFRPAVALREASESKTSAGQRPVG
jgi:hypothetical protein